MSPEWYAAVRNVENLRYLQAVLSSADIVNGHNIWKEYETKIAAAQTEADQKFKEYQQAWLKDFKNG